ncbi:MAG: hypothetical protein QF605_02855 [Rhodospirillales bacterium]|jgi:hypothetical protein|nr:hypothetical protein [Rhodospirillales bacterium]|tara:strand:- start:368 stop:601 length:234 start_codon:yes stop_codon:yes gene_type:complete
MLQHAMNGRKAFEVTLYNKDVRAAVKENQSHTIYGDHWADAQIQDVMAANESEALSLIGRRYPPEEGFVVQELAECS